MKLTSPALAIGWEIWRRNRTMLSTALAVIVAGGIASRFIGPHHPWTSFAESAGYTALAALLVMVFGSFHFTEGRKKGGFGSFPIRLLHLPVSTPWLVALPMIYGSLSILILYFGATLVIFQPLGKNLPILWPCLYLLFGFTQFQMIVWSFPENRYLKLFCLSLAATVILTGWMFFLPHVVEGTLSEWGYTGNPRTFMRLLAIALALTVPGAYLVSLRQVSRQRHGLTSTSGWLRAAWDALAQKLFHRSTDFRSAAQAIFWQEWRQSGLILPLCVTVIVAMICIPSALSGVVGIRGTKAVVTGLLLAPVLLALIIGRGFGKPNFWNPSLNMAPFQAVRPVTAGQWVMSKLKVATGSVILTWAIILSAAAFWLIFCGDFQAFDGEMEFVRFYFTPIERVAIAPLTLLTLMILTWRLLTGGLAAGFSGKKLWFYSQNVATAILIMAALAYLITGGDEQNEEPRLYKLWPYVARMPFLLGLAAVAKFVLAFFLWNKVDRQKLFASESIAFYLLGWGIATAIPCALTLIVFENTLWLKYSLLLLSLLWVPLCGPALASLSLAKNRSSS